MDSTSNHSQDGQTIEALATVAHDLRNHLQGILGCVDLLLEERELEEKFSDADLLKQIRRNALSAHLLVANYLDLSRIEAGLLSMTWQSVHLDKLLRQVGSRYITEVQRKQIRLEYRLQQRLPPIWGDAVALDRVLSNLVHNALKFTPEQGRITLSAARHKGEIALSVTDTGCGIAPTDLSLVFVRGGRTLAAGSSSGSGLGLFIVKTLVEMHGGRVTVASALGQGTQVTAFLQCNQLRGEYAVPITNHNHKE
jgi:signal transduction histidine kinase